MHLQVLSSGSGGNSALLRCGELRLLIDAGLGGVEMETRLDAAGISAFFHTRAPLDHVFVTHGHLDHARSAGFVARKYRARLHCSESLMRNASIRRARDLATLSVGNIQEVDGGVRIASVPLPHDAQPTVAYRVEHGGRVVVVLTDMGRPDEHVARQLAGAHVLVLEFNHDLGMLERGPYPPALKKRVGGNSGHLSNEQAARMLTWLAGPNLHTLVLAHLSEKNNLPELALESAQRTLEQLGLAGRVRIVVASQHAVGENLAV